MTTYDTLLDGALSLHGTGCPGGAGCDCREAEDDARGPGHDHGAARLGPGLGLADLDLTRLAGAPMLSSWNEALPDLGAAFAGLGRADALPVAATQDAFAFGVTVADTVGGIADGVLSAFQTITELALGTWSQFLGAAEGASIEVQVNVGGTDAVASAGPGALEIDEIVDANGSGAFDTGDFVLAVAGSLLEMRTGEDPNGEAADIVVNVNDALLADGAFFFDTTLTAAVPPGQIDVYSVILHELGHGLGFFGLADEPGPDALPVLNFGDEANPILAPVGTLYDVLTQTADGRPRFTGENVTRVYGEAAPLEYLTGSGGSDISHWRLLPVPDGPASDLGLALMNPSVIPGDRVEIGDIELALMADIGHTVVQGTGQLVNALDTLPDDAVPTAFALDGAGLSGDQLTFTIALDRIPPFNIVASGVAVAVEALDGTLLTDRALIQPGARTGEVAFDLDALLAEPLTDRRGTVLDESFALTLYNPSQARLPNGAQQQAFAVEVSGLFGTDQADYLRGTLGDDDLFGGAGDDRLIGGDGDDLLGGGAGDDRLYAGDGADRTEAGGGDDRVISGAGDDTVLGGAGDDVITTGKGADIVLGEGGDDVIRLGQGDDQSDAGAGDDLLLAGGGDDALAGGAGDDTLVAEAGRDVLVGGAGADLFDVTVAENAVIADLDFAEGDTVMLGGEVLGSRAALDAFLASEGVRAASAGSDLVIGFGADQSVTLEGFGAVEVA